MNTGIIKLKLCYIHKHAMYFINVGMQLSNHQARKFK